MLRLSQELNNHAIPNIDDETRWRAAISRAYYACFLTARDALFGDRRASQLQLQRLPREAKAGSHKEVSVAVGSHPGMDPGRRKRQKDQLESLLALRVAADYRRDDGDPRVIELFRRYGASTWDELAHESLTQASLLIPELARIPAFTVT